MIIPQQTPLLLPGLLLLLFRQPIHLLADPMRGDSRPRPPKCHETRSTIRARHRMLRRAIGSHCGSFRRIIFRRRTLGLGNLAFVVRTFSKVACEGFLSYRRGGQVGGAEGRTSNGAMAARLRLYGFWGSRHVGDCKFRERWLAGMTEILEMLTHCTPLLSSFNQARLFCKMERDG